MTDVPALATKINAYNVYMDGGTRLVGVSDEVTLPDFEAMTDTLNGSGILGEIDEPIIGHFGANEIEIPFRSLNRQMFQLVAQQDAVDLTLRQSTQVIDQQTYKTTFQPSRIVIKGKNKAFSGGKVKQGEGTGSSITVEIMYILIEINKKKVFELDKLNFVYKVNDKDILKKVRAQV